MLTLTRKTDYALIAMTHMAQAPCGCCSAREISEQYHMPLPLLMNVLKQLAQRGLTHSVRGPRGGYKLAIQPADIRLSDIIQAVEGPIHLTRCSPKHDDKGLGGNRHRRSCDLTAHCPVRASIHRVHDRLVEFLDGVTLADIVGNVLPNTPLPAQAPTDEVART